MKNSCEWVKGTSAFSTGSYCRDKKGRDDSIMLDSFDGVLEEVLDNINQNRWDKDESSNQNESLTTVMESSDGNDAAIMEWRDKITGII